MAVDEQDRHELHTELAQMLGPKKAATLMELLPGAGWADMATKQDLTDLRVATKQDLEHLRLATKKELEILRADLAQFATKDDLHDLGAGLMKWMVTVNVTSILATAAVVVAATRIG